jgi:hypothetical protein
MRADRVKPRISDHVTCQVIDPATPSACQIACSAVISLMNLVDGGVPVRDVRRCLGCLVAATC